MHSCYLHNIIPFVLRLCILGHCHANVLHLLVDYDFLVWDRLLGRKYKSRVLILMWTFFYLISVLIVYSVCGSCKLLVARLI